VQDDGQSHQRIEAAEVLVNGIDGRIFGNDFCEVVAKRCGRGTVEIGAEMLGLVGELISADAGIFDNMVVLAVINDLHVGIRKVSRAPRAHIFEVGWRRFVSRW